MSTRWERASRLPWTLRRVLRSWAKWERKTRVAAPEQDSEISSSKPAVEHDAKGPHPHKEKSATFVEDSVSLEHPRDDENNNENNSRNNVVAVMGLVGYEINNVEEEEHSSSSNNNNNNNNSSSNNNKNNNNNDDEDNNSNNNNDDDNDRDDTNYPSRKGLKTSPWTKLSPANADTDSDSDFSFMSNFTWSFTRCGDSTGKDAPGEESLHSLSDILLRREQSLPSLSDLMETSSSRGMRREERSSVSGKGVEARLEIHAFSISKAIEARLEIHAFSMSKATKLWHKSAEILTYIFGVLS
eukprot:g82400.t1